MAAGPRSGSAAFTLKFSTATFYPCIQRCVLMGLWRFVIANGMTSQDATAETRAFIDEVSLTDLQKPDVWKSLTTLVKIRPDQDVFPVRAKYRLSMELATPLVMPADSRSTFVTEVR